MSRARRLPVTVGVTTISERLSEKSPQALPEAAVNPLGKVAKVWRLP
ncbi:MAG: hypothetical protein ACO3IL_08795 [Steroidobacteraceae bacterium]|jgi:hypothetical protein